MIDQTFTIQRQLLRQCSSAILEKYAWRILWDDFLRSLGLLTKLSSHTNSEKMLLSERVYGSKGSLYLSREKIKESPGDTLNILQALIDLSNDGAIKLIQVRTDWDHLSIEVLYEVLRIKELPTLSQNNGVENGKEK